MRKTDGAQRLFIALPIPAEIKSAIKALNARIPQFRFIANPHLTLRFIGNSIAAAQYSGMLRQIWLAPFELRAASLGMFRQGVLWLGVEESPELRSLKTAIDSRLEMAGLPPEDKEYKPHITLCRLKHRPAPAIREKLGALTLKSSWLVEKFCLYKSILNPEGAIHERLAEFCLGGS